MSAIRVVLAQSRSDVLARLIADAINDSPDFELVGGAVIPVSHLEQRIPDEERGVQVLIVVRDASPPPLEAFRARHPGMVVSQIFIGSEVVRFDVADVRLDLLLATLRLFARERPVKDRALEYRLTRTGPSDEACALVPMESARDDLFAAAIAWIDAALLHRYASQPSEAGAAAGRARAPTSVVDLLKSGEAPEASAAAQAAETAAAQLFLALEAREARDAPLARLYRELGLTRTELKLVLLALAPELDARYQAIFGILEDDLGRRSPGFALACAIVGPAPGVRGEIASSRNLTLWRLLDTGEMFPRADEPLRLDGFLLAWLLGEDTALLADPRLGDILAQEPWRGSDLLRRPTDLAVGKRLQESLDDQADCDWLVLSGPDAGGWRAQLELAAENLDLDLLRLPLARLAQLSRSDVGQVAVRLARAARLRDMTPVIDAGALDDATDPAVAVGWLAPVLATLGQPMVLIAPELERFAGALRSLRVRGLEAAERSGAAIATAFLTASSNADLSLTQEECERLGLAFPLPLAEIEDAVQLAVLDGALSQSDSFHYEILAAKCRRVASPELPRFAQRITPTFTLDDVVLPAEWHGQLRELVGHVTHAPQVMNAWGFGAQIVYGRGVAALFSGASGTGKTMAAQAIAHELQTEAFLVDLSRIVSKFIGESEKHLDAVFTDAERAGAVLVFDEADAIFGKRSEVKDAHDRYANIEVAYLLQRMETFSGLIILTTNFRQNLDSAFLRRLRFMVEFPKPDAAAREAIWRRCLPKAAPLSADLDFPALARRIEVTGGNIRQITLRAAFAAANESAPAIGMRHVLGAARAELEKLGRASAVRELEEYEALRLKTSRQAA